MVRNNRAFCIRTQWITPSPAKTKNTATGSSNNQIQHKEGERREPITGAGLCELLNFSAAETTKKRETFVAEPFSQIRRDSILSSSGEWSSQAQSSLIWEAARQITRNTFVLKGTRAERHTPLSGFSELSIDLWTFLQWRFCSSFVKFPFLVWRRHSYVRIVSYTLIKIKSVKHLGDWSAWYRSGWAKEQNCWRNSFLICKCFDSENILNCFHNLYLWLTHAISRDVVKCFHAWWCQCGDGQPASRCPFLPPASCLSVSTCTTQKIPLV